MAYWDSKVRVYFGDAFGNPLEAYVGVVTVNKRTTLGVQFNPETPHKEDQPDITFDWEGLDDFITVLTEQREGLGRATGKL